MTTRYEHPTSEHHTCDPEADTARYGEIRQLQTEGYDISVGGSIDLAYEQPHKIEEVYTYLRAGDEALAAQEMDFMRGRTGWAAMLSIFPKIAHRHTKDKDAFLEPHRETLLFGPTQTDALDWHHQRGKALALLTITYAHDFATPANLSGKYNTMSGPLNASLFDYRFSSDVDGFGGLSLREAMIKSRVEFSGKSSESAAEWADRTLGKTRAFIDAPVTDKFREVIQYCYDSQGIRDRKAEVNAQIGEHIATEVDKGRNPKDMLVMSFGCGTALPTMEAMLDAKERHGTCPTLILLDQDPLALAAAAVLAEQMGLKDSIEIHCQKLFSKFGKPLSLEGVLGERELDIAEDSGLREYLPDRIYKDLTRETWSSIRPGGLMVTGNMNSHRPQSEFLHGLMGWLPRVQMRSIREGLRLHEAAGVPRGNTRVRVTKSGVYSVFGSRKSAL